MIHSTFSFKDKKMTKAVCLQHLAVFAIAVGLTACGPETNSRYGDEFWDPQATWEAAAVVTQPDLSIVYRNDGGTPPANWEGYVSVDFSDLTLQSEGSVVLSYTTGSEEPQTVSDLVQAGSSDLDTKFFYDSTNSTDYRLQLTRPANYTFYLDFSVRQPNGTLRVYNYSWSDVALPGEVSRDEYYADYINENLEDNCHGCHGGADAAANTVFPMDNTNVNTLRTSLINEINSPTAGNELPAYAFSSSHSGQGSANNMTATERTTFTDFVNELVQRKADGDNITTNLTDLFSIDVPTTTENDPYE
jgi:hypothetical protein